MVGRVWPRAVTRGHSREKGTLVSQHTADPGWYGKDFHFQKQTMARGENTLKFVHFGVYFPFCPFFALCYC